MCDIKKKAVGTDSTSSGRARLSSLMWRGVRDNCRAHAGCYLKPVRDVTQSNVEVSGPLFFGCVKVIIAKETHLHSDNSNVRY